MLCHGDHLHARSEKIGALSREDMKRVGNALLLVLGFAR